jgi:hypothetical protein
MAAHDARNKADPKDHLVSQGQSVLIEHTQHDDSLQDESVRNKSWNGSKLGRDIVMSWRWNSVQRGVHEVGRIPAAGDLAERVGCLKWQCMIRPKRREIPRAREL